jgi:hypothetical protein
MDTHALFVGTVLFRLTASPKNHAPQLQMKSARRYWNNSGLTGIT